MLLVLVILCVTLGITAYQFRRDFHTGLACAVFFLLLLPESVGFSLGPALPTFTVHRLIVVLTLVFWIRNRSNNRSPRGAPFYRTQLWITAAYLVSTFLSAFILVSLKRWLYFTIESVVFFVIVLTSLTDDRARQKIIVSASAALVVVSLYAVFERQTGIHIAQILPRSVAAYEFEDLAFRQDQPSGDTVSTYGHRILLGIGTAIGVVAYFVRFSTSTKKSSRIMALVATTVCGAGLYFSLSRGPWLSCAAAMCWMVILLPRKLLTSAAILAVFAGGLLLLRPGALDTIRALGHATTNPNSIKGSSFRWRAIVVETAVSHLWAADPAHFLFGFGGGSHVFTDFGSVQLSSGHYVQMESWDCEFAVVLYEQGMVGFTLVVVLYGSFFLRTARQLRRTRLAPNPAMLFCVGCVTIIVVSKLSAKIFTPQLVYLEALSLGIASQLLCAGIVVSPKSATALSRPGRR